LAADSPTPILGLTLLAFGNVRIRNLTLFDAAAANGDAAPALSFSSSPVPGQDPVTGGLIVYNPNHEEPLSIRLNGADLTLAWSAVVQAQPGEKMTVIMVAGSALVDTAAGSGLVNTAAGSALVNTAAGDGALIPAHQLTVPLDGEGKATGAPTTPTKINSSQWADIAPPLDDDLLALLVPPQSPQDIRSALLGIMNEFEDAYDRCMQGNSRQVYRIMYFARILKLYARLYPTYFPDSIMDMYDLDVRTCATFEVEFNSVITGTSSVAWGDMYIQGQGMIVRYGMDGRLDQPATMPLTHLRYDVDFALTCNYVRLNDGRLSLMDGYMRINRNRLDISTTMMPVDVHEHFIYTCGPTFEMANPAAWFTLFWDLHRSEHILTGLLFTPAHWKYTGNQILAEAIFTDRQVMFNDGVATGSTWIVMLHKPGG